MYILCRRSYVGILFEWFVDTRSFATDKQQNTINTTLYYYIEQIMTF